ncbi:MAG: uracil-DNA glycosylase family protein, partial [Sporichthyaceae bacterium]
VTEFDPGPPQPFHDLFDDVPDYGPFKQHFWFDWGPVFYRGRLDGSARVLCVASDPGPTERVAARALVGDAGQRVQGFVSKLGLTRSYLCLNAFAYALFPSHGTSAPAVLADQDLTAWRNDVFDAARSPSLQAVVAFGRFAQIAVKAWPGKSGLPVFEVPHPSSRAPTVLLDEWRAKILLLRGIVTPDPDGDATGPNYGTTFGSTDYTPIPRRDLPFGVPDWLGDDTWGRTAHPRHNNSVSRPSPDDRHTLRWIAPITD